MKRSLAFLCLLICTVAIANQPRIVAIADVHGDLNSFIGILQTSGLIDQNQNWSGGNTIFVQMGDILDRGSKGRPALDLMMKLENQSRKQGGHVYALLGNHEVMNIMGDLRYVPADEFANFANENSQKKLDQAYKTYMQFQTEKAKRLKQAAPEFSEKMKDDWLKTYPPGFLEHREAYGPTGKYGKWLRSHDAVLDLNHNIFLHGGISPKFESMSVQDLNHRITQELQFFDRIQKTLVDQKVILSFFTLDEILTAVSEELKLRGKDQNLEAIVNIQGWLSVGPEGPLWFRGYSQWNDDEIQSSLPNLLKAYQAQRIIVGHTVQQNGEIHSRQSLRIVMIDTGMNSAFFPGGRASALEIIGPKLTAIYSEARIILTADR